MPLPDRRHRASGALILIGTTIILSACGAVAPAISQPAGPILGSCDLSAIKTEVEQYLVYHAGDDFEFQMPEGGCRFIDIPIMADDEPEAYLVYEVLVARKAEREHQYSFQIAQKNGEAISGVGAAYGTDGVSLLRFLKSGD